MNGLVSIIVPVYNVEKYLDRCIKSIVKQTYNNLEIVLVDDGSQDQCPQICDWWAEKDKRIKVVHKSNGGLSDARNAGMEIATGDYIAFVDSDDWIEEDLYRILLDAIKATNSDIACCKFRRIGENFKQASSMANDSGAYELFDTKESLLELITENKIQQVVWNKLYRKNVISDIEFAVGKCNEDDFWTYQVLGKAYRVVSVDVTGYYYWQRNNSIMGVSYSPRRLDAVEAKICRQVYLEKYFPELNFAGKRDLLYTCLYHGQMLMKHMSSSDREDAMLWLEKTFITYGINNQEKNNLNTKDKMWLKLGSSFFRLTCFVRNMFGIGC